MDIDKVLDLLNRRTIGAELHAERALYLLLNGNKEDARPVFESCKDAYDFHVALRQIDVCKQAYLDLALHRLLSASTVFWEVCEELGYKAA